MAIAKMEKLSLVFPDHALEDILYFLQSFQGVHIEPGAHASVPEAQKTRTDRKIREAENTLRRIQTAYNILNSIESAKSSGLYPGMTEQELSNQALSQIVEESDWDRVLDDIIRADRRLQSNRQKRQETLKLMAELKLWEPLNCNPLDFSRLQRSSAIYGSVHQRHAADFSDRLLTHENSGICFEAVTAVDDRSYFLVVCHQSMSATLAEIMQDYSFFPQEYNFELPPPGARERLGRESFDLLEEEKEISTNLGELSQHLGLLRLAEDYTLNALLRLRKSLEVTYSEATITIEGWIFADRRHQFEEMLTASFLNTPCSVTFSPIYDKDIPLVPIKLQNNRLVTPYESLTDMYSLPRYNEVDPTPVMTVFYQLFFGMMVADIGYGLTLFIIGQIVRRRMKLSRDTRSFIDFLYYLCFPIIGWGVVFGSFFGLELPFGLLSANTDIIPLTILSIVLGCLHIIAGLVLYMINQAKLQNYADMLSGGLSWILTFIGGGLAILVSTVPAFESAFFYWIGMGLVTIGVALIVFVPAIKRGKHWYVGIGTGLYALYGATSYIGDFISYTRLMALAVAGASVALAFNTILGFLPLPVRLSLGLVVAVILHALNIFLSMLSAYVHGIRLEFIEFFGKFYSGGGRKFDPFKTAEKNVIICDPVNTDN